LLCVAYAGVCYTAIYTAADIWINPARAFGPAFIANQFGSHHWVAWLGPLLGAVSGALCFQYIFCEKAAGGEEMAAEKASHNNGSGGSRSIVDVESHPDKAAMQQLVVNDKQRNGATSIAGGRSRVRPTSTSNGEATAIFFNYNAANADLDNLSLDGTKEGRELRRG
jgi:hypothetical protein